MTRTATLDASANLMTDIHAHLRACEAARNMRTAEWHLKQANALIEGAEFEALPETVQEEICGRFEMQRWRFEMQRWRVQPIGA